MMAAMSGMRTPMSEKDMRRVQVMGLVVEGRRSLAEAAEVMGVSYRQAKRVLRRYREEGPAGLGHRNVGRPSGRRIDEALRQAVLTEYEKSYSDFGPTLAAEKLAERDGLAVDHETLRRWLIAEGMWKSRRQRRRYRSRRDRRQRFGELVQFDGSHHAWFEERRAKCCLMNMVDDATGTTLSFLDEQETTNGALRLLWAWIERYGVPVAVYCDRKNAFVLDREPTVSEQLQGITPKSTFELACEKLGIEVIVARSPQAKGRVERNHGVYQDRFVKELRLAGIDEIGEANEFLRESFLDTLNAKFAKPPIDPEDAHVALLAGQRLENILCFEERRVVGEDYVVQFERKLLQIQRQKRGRLPAPGTQVIVRKWLDGSVHVFTKENTELLVEELEVRSKKNEEDALSA
jgi:transposase